MSCSDQSRIDDRETCGRGLWLGPPLFAAVPETGHNIGVRRPAPNIRHATRRQTSARDFPATRAKINTAG